MVERICANPKCCKVFQAKSCGKQTSRFCCPPCGRYFSPVEARFWERFNKTNTCWLWNRPLQQTGYGQIFSEGRPIAAHRLSWQLHFGAIPEGMSVCHTCDVKHCVNPSHLFLGSPKDNTHDMIKKGRGLQPKTSCIRGHLLEGDNLYLRKDNGQRMCRACCRIRQLERYRRLRNPQTTSKIIEHEMPVLSVPSSHGPALLRNSET